MFKEPTLCDLIVPSRSSSSGVAKNSINAAWVQLCLKLFRLLFSLPANAFRLSRVLSVWVIILVEKLLTAHTLWAWTILAHFYDTHPKWLHKHWINRVFIYFFKRKNCRRDAVSAQDWQSLKASNSNKGLAKGTRNFQRPSPFWNFLHSILVTKRQTYLDTGVYDNKYNILPFRKNMIQRVDNWFTISFLYVCFHCARCKQGCRAKIYMGWIHCPHFPTSILQSNEMQFTA